MRGADPARPQSQSISNECPGCGRPAGPDQPENRYGDISLESQDTHIVIFFLRPLPTDTQQKNASPHLVAEGFERQFQLELRIKFVRGAVVMPSVDIHTKCVYSLADIVWNAQRDFEWGSNRRHRWWFVSLYLT